jgi:hypothetical protein
MSQMKAAEGAAPRQGLNSAAATDPSPQAFLKAFFLVLLALTILFFGVITLVDPNRYFFDSRFPQVTPNSRRTKIELFRKYNEQSPVSGFLFGGSNCLLLSPEKADSLTGLRFFNASVFNARPDDVLGMYQVFRDLHAAPQLIVIGVNLIALSTNYPEVPEPDFNLARHLQPGLSPVVYYARLYGKSFALQELTDLKDSVRLAVQPVEPMYHYYPDGYTDYVKSDRQIREGTYDRSGEFGRLTSEYEAFYRGFNAISQPRMEAFEDLLATAEQNRSRVILWLTPLHPELRARVDQLPDAVRTEAAAADRVRRLSRQYGATLVDLSSPSSFHSTVSTWYDSVHMSRADSDQILGILLADVKTVGK